ncbi:armadillo-type protein [Mycena albidolilacea]|uniref:Nucleolar protein 9 n=1 Tax=Mycena albidolilacea TaxID=1033008 RepID=A0AAD7F489_9AGAR|nr:armadillo-type protein [Mycena albidolilacea]
MPKEHRKRGKKKKPEPEWQPPVENTPLANPQAEKTPSWIVPAQNSAEDVNPEAPFGYVDVDVKAYFRTVDVQIRDWQDTAGDLGTNDEDTDPNEERRMFFVAALTEMSGKEKQLATDPDCSLILERMAYSMDDFVRRVFVDSLIGSYDVLVKHRFASHVCQTLFTVASQTVSREKRGILSTVPESSDKGELRLLTQLVIDVCEELFPVFASLVMNPFASHVIRALLLLLSPNLVASHESGQHAMRSKKSAVWKAKQGPLKSVFKESDGRGDSGCYTPPEVFTQTARKFVEAVRRELDANETRALAADKVASPTLQMLLAVEADQQMTEDPDSLMDRVLVGLVSSSRDDPSAAAPVSDYLNTLLRDPTSSHLLETIVTRCPGPAFSILWATYFTGNLPRIASHPVANFVLAKALERVSVTQLTEACGELQNVWTKLIQTSRTGVLRAVIDRAAILKACGSEITDAVSSGFQTTTPEERNLLVPCVLRLQTLQDFKAAPKPSQGEHRRAPNDPHEPKVQGAILLQSLLRLPEPHYQLVTESLNSLSEEDILAIAHHATSSRVLDALLDSPTVPQKVKRQFVLSFIGRYHVLVDDRIGSRVGDRCWAFSDTYLKEKIARSLIPQEQFLAGSYYGKFFARNLNLYLLQRRPDEWRTMQSDRKRAAEPPAVAAPSPVQSAEETKKERKKRKRDAAGDEIDDLFGAALGKKVKKAALVDAVQPESKVLPSGKETALDRGLSDVMGAIRAAPGEGKGKRKR